MQHRGAGVGVSSWDPPLCSRTPCLPRPQLGFGVSIPRGELVFGVSVPRREVTATYEFTLCDRCRLRPADSEQRERVWSLLRGLLETYSHLREEDQSFAVEVPMLWGVPHFWGVPGVGGCVESQDVGRGGGLGTLG